MRVLIVEDDAALGLFLLNGLKLEGHEVSRVTDGESALLNLSESTFDLVVLDLGLPRRDGIEVLIELRQRCKRTAVLILTGRSNIEEKVKCLNLGADDCLLKPFSFAELRARCRALLRRRELFADPLLQHQGVALNRITRRVTRDGRTIDLTAKEFLLLEFLLERPGQCCSREVLMKAVWDMAPHAATNVVDVYINYLRKKLEDDPMTEPFIQTVRGSGYLIGGSGQKKLVRSTTAMRTTSSPINQQTAIA